MKGSRFTKWMSIALSAMLVFTLFPVQALADGADETHLDASTPDPVIMYTVEFVDWDGKTIDTDEVASGEGATAPEHPEREGYEPDGWDKDFSVVTGDMTVTAQYKEAVADDRVAAKAVAPVSNTININFYSKNGSVLIASYSKSGLSDDQIDDLDNDQGSSLITTLTGVFGTSFVGRSSFGSNDFVNNGGLKLSGDGPIYTINAYLKIDIGTTYTIRYVDTAGVSIHSDDTNHSKDVGDSVTVFAREIDGYEVIPPNFQMGVLKYSGNVFTFVYTRIQYTVTYEANDGTGTMTDPNSPYNSGTSFTVLANGFTAPAHMKFAGWNTRPRGNGSDYDVGSSRTITHDLTLYAQWERLPEYSVTYHKNDGSGHMFDSNSPYEEGTSFTVLANTFNAPSGSGKSFAGWNTAANGTGTNYVVGTSYTISGNVKLYAQWAFTRYTISYVLNGGTNAPGNPTSYIKTDLPVTPAAPTRSGYTFTGWTPANIPVNSTGDKTFTAGWSGPIDYAITYNLDGGANHADNPSSYNVTTQTFTLGEPTKPGYTFAGWTPTDITIEQGSTGPLTFTAAWSAPIDYTITYNLFDGTNHASNPPTYNVTTETFTLGEPTKDGYTFAGWTPAGVIEKGSIGDKTFDAAWTPITYAISYELNGGVNAANPTTYTPDSPTITLLDPTRDGYTFAGWSPTNVIETGTFGDLTFTASWTPITYSISYELHGGVNAAGNPVSYTPDSLTITLAAPTRDGYTFTGWTPAGVIAAGSFGDKSFEAGWRANSYTITYTLNGGRNAPGNPTSYTPDSPTITLGNPTRNGYVFAGWTPTGTIPTGSFGAKTFVASWTAQAYTITYNLSGGTNAPSNPATYTILSPRIWLSDPSRTGYHFVRWSPLGVISAGSTGDKTFTAVWTPVTYRIYYNLNGGLNTLDNPLIYNIESGTITLHDPSRIGYDFAGWTPTGTIPTGSTGDKTFTASWTPKVYSISYELFGGTNAAANPSSYTIESPTINLADPTRAGYSFLFWLPFDNVGHGSFGDRTFVAVWSLPIRYNISYNLNGGTNAPGNPSHYWVVSPTITLNNPTRPGYNFAGWTPGNSIPSGSTGHLTFTANWTPIAYSISYDLAGGVNAAGNPASYTIETPTFTLGDPTRDYYTFAGWSPADVTIEQGSKGNLSFTASWTPVAYSISYDLAGGANAAGNPASYTVETTTFTLGDPTRDYYTFAGWTPSDTTVEQGSHGDLTFTASWTPIAYSISYDLAGGVNAAGNPASYTVETPTFTLGDPTRDYYTFAGWTPADTTVELGSHGDLSFTASWTPIAYSITYDLAGGVNAAGNPASYTVETPTFTLGNPTRAGYNFIGWIPNATTVALGSHGNLSYTALWSAPIVYTITYALGGGTNAPTNPATYTVESAAITLAPATIAGYNFLAWTPGNTIPAGSTGDKTFTATWSAPIVYGITYVMNGGINAGANPATYTVESATINLAAPTRAGYNFTGWTPAGTIPAGSIGGRTFTATWSAPIVYDITYVMNGGVNAPANPATYTVVSGLITLQDPTREGYDFLGWTPTDNIPAASTGARSFTATWSQPHVHTVTYIVTGGTQAGLDGATPFAIYRDVAYGDPVPVPDDPTQDEFSFDGWSTAIPATMPDEDVTLYGTLTRLPVLQEIITNERTPLAGATWSLLNLILTVLTALGGISIVSMLRKKRAGTGSAKNTAFSFSTLLPAAGAILAFVLTQIMSGTMVFADRWSYLMGGIALVQGVLVGLGLFGGAKKA